LALAQQAVAAGVKRMVFISTVGVHGATSQAPLVETSALAPHTPYAESKLQAELGLFALHQKGAVEVVVIRPPMVYGPQAPGNFMRLAKWVEKGWPLPFAQVRNQRSLVGIDNLVHFIALCMQHPRAAGEAFLVADGEDVSTPQLITGMAQALGVAPRLWHMPPALLRIGAQCTGQKALWQQLCGNLQINTDKASSLLGWQAPCTLEQGLHKALACPPTP
jgi:nucleoside-diphosphate-sugar epimerase